MDHSKIDDQQIAELYVLDRLSPAEQEEMEEHLLHCAECQQRVALAEILLQGLRSLPDEPDQSSD